MKPLLSSTADTLDDIVLPALASPKLDGVRALVLHGTLVSRNLKPIPNQYVRSLFEHPHLEGLDGELLFGDPTSKTVFADTLSAVMTKKGKPANIRFHVFDCFTHPHHPFNSRLDHTREKVSSFNIPELTIVPHYHIQSLGNLAKFEEWCVTEGYEGIMCRDPDGRYKLGRSTLREQILVKLKRFTDAKARVLGFEELMQNTNVMTRDNLGRAKRPSHRSGMVGKNTLGALLVEGLEPPFTGIRFGIGSGLNDILRQQIWYNQHLYMNKILSFKYFPIGSKDAPRFPTLLRFEELII